MDTGPFFEPDTGPGDTQHDHLSLFIQHLLQSQLSQGSLQMPMSDVSNPHFQVCGVSLIILMP